MVRADNERQMRAFRKTIKDMGQERHDLYRKIELLEQINGARSVAPKWLSPKESKRGHRATAYLQITDTHFEEKINPEEIEGLNKYDRRIAGLRLRRAFEQFIVVMRDFHKGVEYDGVVVPMTGDCLLYTSDAADE